MSFRLPPVFSARPVQVAIGAVGLLSAIVTIFTSPGPVSLIAKISAVFLFVGAVTWTLVEFTIQRFREGLPDVSVIDALTTSYRVSPATSEDVRWAARLAQRVYTGFDVIPERTMLDWYEVFPNGFFIIKGKDGHRVGNLDVLPLRPSTMKRLLDGDILEHEITGDCLYSCSEAASIKDLYIESFVAVTAQGSPNAGAAVHTLSELPAIVQTMCPGSKIKSLFALAASKNGKRILRRLGFDLISSCEGRRDGHDLYCGNLSDVARNILATFGDRVKETAVLDLVNRLDGSL